MKKNYNPQLIEKKLYKIWEEKKYFKTSIKKSSKKSFCIIMPPPNITGVLHMGHALQQTIMDILIRFNRMKGRNVLFQIGLDHAGIATQLLIEKKILKKNKNYKLRYDKKYFFKKAWKWVEKYKHKIFNQIKRLGHSIDWDRKKFTLDSDVSKGVRKAFIILYNQGLIYKKKKIVNWDVCLKTVISDLEVINKTVKSKMYYIKYFFYSKKYVINNKNYIIVATTRPETIFGDSAIGVNPKDLRYKDYIGLKVFVPIINRLIPIISDTEVEIDKGTGCMKITPAHDFLDYKIGMKHNLPIIQVFSLNGNILKKLLIYSYTNNKDIKYNYYIPLFFQKMNRFEARKQIIIYLKKNNILCKVELLDSNIPYCERSNSIVEPMLTNQWFLKTSKFVEKSISTVINKKINFFPKKYKNMYLSWMKNIEDWCISRQLWWGHRIPIWYDKDKKIYVGKNKLNVIKKYQLKKDCFLKQEKDVLDTWFSSSLWTFLALDWPKNKNLLKKFHPTNVIVSGFDIIFFWIARMIMLTTHIIKDKNNKSQIPFKNIYITGLIRDEKGQKMSKSKGNIIDPIDLIDGISLKKLIKKRIKNVKNNDLKKKNIIKKITKLFPNGIQAFGADSLRFTCVALSTYSRNIFWDMNRLQGYRNFCNKLWHASRFVFLNRNFINKKNIKISNITLLQDQWILSELHILIQNYKKFIKNYRFDLVSNLIYEFVWFKFCDWYLEISKIIIRSGTEQEKINTQNMLMYILKQILKLLHPIIPFITEYIWKKVFLLNNDSHQNSLINHKFPKFNLNSINYESLEYMSIIQNFFKEMRSIRKSMNIKYSKKINVLIKNSSKKFLLIVRNYKNFLQNIMYLKKIQIFTKIDKNIIQKFIIRKISECELLIPIKEFINKDLEINTVLKKIKDCMLKIKILNTKVMNVKFLKNAPKEIVNKEKNKLNILENNLKSLKKYKKLLLSI
ncbi:valine--tRNA ligase [Buchnera aphidicola]|uniref:valine--tRNA ligase n=1 Tax=Buchnera aphidicola TaxID=9 RepID=UPI0022388FC2|nr:valine--tRNA ligase [Buchnera aphidicola]MCW5197786.1 valine--tRNA ligase [Buchnera aphidicola (Chaitophorus viminalis)]